MSWNIEQRLSFIETRLFWEGQINRKDLIDFFNISVPQASADLKRYLAEAPGNMLYDASQKVYKTTPGFSPKYISTDPREYFLQLQPLQGKRLKQQIYLGYFPAFYTLPYPQRNIEPKILKQVLKAMREKKALEIKYQSMTRPEPHWRWITPHAFGFDGFRWHIRAYCHSRKAFRDFVLGRILEIDEDRPHKIDPALDIPWNTMVTFRIAPKPHLSEAQKKMVELEYGMENGILEFTIKAAFIVYALRRFSLIDVRESTTEDDIFSGESGIVLLNKEEIQKKWKELEVL